jgi:hypothetical protein
VRKPEAKRPLGRPRCRRVDNIRMDLEEVSCGDVDLAVCTFCWDGLLVNIWVCLRRI